jgi:flagellar hook assembly protein FlgD
MRKLLFILLVAFCLSLHAVSALAQSRIPNEANNYLQVVGQSGLGGLDTVNVVFFEIPDTVSSTLYFTVRSPENDGANAEDNGNGGNTTFYLIGGSGTLSDEKSRQLMYDAGEMAGNDHLTGTTLDSQIFGSTYAQEWFYFGAVNPSQGEHIANKYYFKIVTEAEAGTSGKNGYQLDISTSSGGNPTGLAGVRAFAYSWMVGFHWSGRDWSLYPFVPENETGFVVFSNWDLDLASNPDVSGTAFNKSNAQTEASSLGAINPSGNGVAENTSYAIAGGENNGTWKAKYNEGVLGVDYYNNSEIWHWNSAVAVNDSIFRDIAQPYRTYADYFAPSLPDHVVLTAEDGTADADGVDTERVLIQIVDSSGDPQHYIRNVHMTVSGSAQISSASDTSDSLPAAAALVTTDSDGLAWITVVDDVDEMVFVTAVTNGSNGSDTLPGTNTAVNITFGSGSVAAQFSLRNNIIDPQQGDTVEIVVGLSSSQSIKAKVYDLAGNPVKTLTDSTFAAGTHSITWDGKSKRGRPVSKDVYFIVITVDGTRKVFKVLVVK